ncbi:MAG: sulfotransferase [Erythrobacter sp.]|jgi:hypothetical protein|nr:sulfotransferase [Erythrobacter sp.]
MNVPLRSHPLARSRLATRANDWLSHAWTKGWLPAPPLDADAMWTLATKPYGQYAIEAEIGGRRPSDVRDFRARLERLIQSVDEEADLNSLGRTMAYGQLMRVIRNRLQLGALWTARPEILATPLAAPIIVIGHMRSGTTRIHKLLAADPAHSHTRYCDAYHPVPGRFALKRFRSKLDLAMLSALNPWLQTIHPMAASEVEEELAWLAAALNHSIYESQWRVPGFSAFSEARHAGPVYREFTRILRTDAAHRSNGARPRVLKVPAFSEDLAVLLEQFPDARIIVAERETAAVLRSAVSLVANQMAVQSDTCDLTWIEGEWRRKLALRDARMQRALSGWTGPVARLSFDALNADWESEIRRAYRDLAMPLTLRALDAMRTAMAESHTGHHRAHSEQLARFAAET